MSMPVDWTEIDAVGLWPRHGQVICDAPRQIQTALCQRWLEVHAAKRTTISRSDTSYGLKHMVEDWTTTLSPAKRVDMFREMDVYVLANDLIGHYIYVSNGAFIEAARRAKYRIVRAWEGSPNAYFNLSIRAWRQQSRRIVLNTSADTKIDVVVRATTTQLQVRRRDPNTGRFELAARGELRDGRFTSESRVSLADMILIENVLRDMPPPVPR